MKLNLPNLLVLGAQKAGTTTFFEKLSLYKDFFLPLKEIKFFHRDEFYNKGIEWYSDIFKEYNQEKYIGDFTPDYMAYAWSAERIYKTLGTEVKLIFVLRQPLVRSYSQFNFHRMYEVEFRKDFIEAMKTEPIGKSQDKFITWNNPENYLGRSLYFNQIRRFLNYFPKENIHVIIFEELFIHKNKKSLDDLEAFLEVKLPGFFEAEKHSNPSNVPESNLNFKFLKAVRSKGKILIEFSKKHLPKQMYDAIKSKVLNSSYSKPSKLSGKLINEYTEKYFKEDIEELEQFLGRPIDVWKNIS